MARRPLRIRFQQIALGVVVGLIVLAFVFVFGQPRSGGGPDVVAEVAGEMIGRDAFEFFRDQVERRTRALQPGAAEDPTLETQLDLLALDTLVQRYVMAGEAEALGLRVEDEEIREEICAQPTFQRDGVCDASLLALFIARSEFDNERSYTNELRRDLLIRKLTRLVSSPIRISRAAVRDQLQRERLSVRLRYAVARGEDFLDQVSATDEEARALAESEPERVAAAYARRLDEFRRPEEIRARHILWTGPDAMERAQAARKRIEAGEDFVVLATQLSEDEATRESGGDLGFFPRGRMLPEFDEAAFAAETRSLAGPVQTERGAHLIRVEERRPAVDRPLEEVSLELARELLRQDGAGEAARAAAERMAELLREGSEFDAAAREAGLALDETILFRPADPLVPGIGRVPGLREEAARLTPEDPVSRQVFGSTASYYLISLLERRELDEETLEAELGPAQEQAQREARGRVLTAWYRERLEALDRGGELTRFPLYPAN